MASDDPKAAAEIFYDGACPICRREIAAYRALPGLERAAWTDVSAAEVVAPDLDREMALSRFHVRRADGTLISGFRAFLAIWRASPRLRWLAAALDRRPITDLGEGAYRGFLVIRRVWRR